MKESRSTQPSWARCSHQRLGLLPSIRVSSRSKIARVMAVSNQFAAGEEGAEDLEQMAQVVTAGQFADRVHGKGRHADIQRAYAQSAGGDRADGRATAQVAAHHETL